MPEQEWIDAEALYGWLLARRPGELTELRLASHAREVRRWKTGGATSVYTADRVLTKLDLSIAEIPDGIWVGQPRGYKHPVAG